jgi:hypothetical protein
LSGYVKQIILTSGIMVVIALGVGLGIYYIQPQLSAASTTVVQCCAPPGTQSSSVSDCGLVTGYYTTNANTTYFLQSTVSCNSSTNTTGLSTTSTSNETICSNNGFYGTVTTTNSNGNPTTLTEVFVFPCSSTTSTTTSNTWCSTMANASILCHTTTNIPTASNIVNCTGSLYVVVGVTNTATYYTTTEYQRAVTFTTNASTSETIGYQFTTTIYSPPDDITIATCG